MNDVRINPEEEVKASPIDSIIRAYRYNEFRRHPSVNGKAAAKYLCGVIKKNIADNDSKGWFAYLGDEPVGYVSISPLAWDSDYFGLRMARLIAIVTAKQSNQVYSVADQLLNTALSAARRSGIQHLSLCVDVEDTGLIHALEKNDFRLMDTRVTYVFDKKKNQMADIQSNYDVRLYRPEDYDVVIDIAAKCFEGYPNRFNADPNIPKKRARAFYRDWAINCCKGVFADEVLVAERKGRVIGFLGYGMNTELERHTGTRVIGNGLGGCYPFHFNAFIELMQECTRRSLIIANAVEAETQSFNVAMINYLPKINYSYIRARHSFHLGLIR